MVADLTLVHEIGTGSDGMVPRLELLDHGHFHLAQRQEPGKLARKGGLRPRHQFVIAEQRT